MNTVWMIIVVFLGGSIGLYLDLYKNVKDPHIYWFLGGVTGAFALVAGLWPLIGD